MGYLTGLYADYKPKTALICAIGTHDNDVVMHILDLAKNDTSFAEQLNINDAFILSITQRNPVAFEALLTAGADIECQDDSGYTPLSCALMDEGNCLFDRLIQLSADINLKNKNGNTLLMTAAQNNNLNALQALITANANLDARHDIGGTTALFMAAENGHDRCLKALIKAGANIHIIQSVHDTMLGNYFISPFFAAIKYDHLDCVKLLVNAGVDVFEKHEKLNDAWSLAEENGCLDIINYLNAHVEQLKLSLLIGSSNTQNNVINF